MNKKRLLSFKKKGYIEEIPINDNIDNYEKIEIKERSGIKTTLFRHILKENKSDDISNYDKSWSIFNSLVNQ